MDVCQAIQTRRSIRKYKKQPIEAEKLAKVLEAGRLSPSARNLQEWKFVIVQDEHVLQQLIEACNGQSFVGQAPAFIAVCATNPGDVMGCGQPRSTVDLSIAMAYMILQAQELGLGTCWLGSYKQDKVRQLLNVPDHVDVVAVTPIGYPAEQPGAKPRKAIGEVVCYERYRI